MSASSRRVPSLVSSATVLPPKAVAAVKMKMRFD
jgi:hypothetical protein